MTAKWGVKDTLTGVVYPQPNKLIAERVAELHGHSEVISLSATDADREALADIWAIEHGGSAEPDRHVRVGYPLADAILAAGFRRQGPITDANPQAWQYGVLGGFPESVMGPMSSRASAEGLCGGDPTRLMRRRPGVAPGPWEPVEAAERAR